MSEILVAEDEDALRRFIFEEFLRDEGYQVVGFPDGQAALAYLRRGGPLPCMIITDYMMPRLNGAALCRAIQADPALAGVPLVLTGAGPQSAAEAAALQVDFLEKPFGERDLLQIVQRYCGPRP